jgi:hypothetical protein
VFDAFDEIEHAVHRGQRVMPLAVVIIAVSAEQDLRPDLSEAIDNTIDAEVGGTARPDCANAASRQHGNDRFRAIRQIAGNTIALRDASRPQTLCDPCNRLP